MIESRLEVLSVPTGEREVVHSARAHFEAPNWSPDGGSLLFNQDGRILVLPLETRTPRLLDTGTATRCNNDHGLSRTGSGWRSATSRRTAASPSSTPFPPREGSRSASPRGAPPTGTAGRPTGGRSPTARSAGASTTSTRYRSRAARRSGSPTAPGLDDGPDYAPDGRIWFNSARTGVMKIWRMDPDGKDQTQLTHDEEYADWFPHPRPTGSRSSSSRTSARSRATRPNQDVVLRLMPIGGGEPRVVARLFGGQGTINVPSWSPDGTRFAFVSYRLLGK